MSIEPSERDGSVFFSVRAIPRSSRSAVIGGHNGAVKVRIASSPVEGAANKELIKLLAKQFGVAKRDIEIVSGETSRNKRIKIANLSISRFEELIK